MTIKSGLNTITIDIRWKTIMKYIFYAFIFLWVFNMSIVFKWTYDGSFHEVVIDPPVDAGKD